MGFFLFLFIEYYLCIIFYEIFIRLIPKYLLSKKVYKFFPERDLIIFILFL